MSEPTGNGQIDTPDAPPDDADAGLEGNLGQVGDEPWLAAHQQLIASDAIPAEELRFLFDPSRDPDDVVPEELMYGGGLDG